MSREEILIEIQVLNQLLETANKSNTVNLADAVVIRLTELLKNLK